MIAGTSAAGIANPATTFQTTNSHAIGVKAMAATDTPATARPHENQNRGRSGFILPITRLEITMPPKKKNSNQAMKSRASTEPALVGRQIDHEERCDRQPEHGHQHREHLEIVPSADVADSVLEVCDRMRFVLVPSIGQDRWAVVK